MSEKAGKHYGESEYRALQAACQIAPSLESAIVCIRAAKNYCGSDIRSSEVILSAFEKAALSDPAAVIEMCREFKIMFFVSGEFPMTALFSNALTKAVQDALMVAGDEETENLSWVLQYVPSRKGRRI